MDEVGDGFALFFGSGAALSKLFQNRFHLDGVANDDSNLLTNSGPKKISFYFEKYLEEICGYVGSGHLISGQVWY